MDMTNALSLRFVGFLKSETSMNAQENHFPISEFMFVNKFLPKAVDSTAFGRNLFTNMNSKIGQ